mmetsp:Transcript_22086/g.30692  ORF Transcript_22086/g.30692 Transcript_22086/m.30692 type:complete len:226 (-) Transcript_22086:1516-2193(-)
MERRHRREDEGPRAPPHIARLLVKGDACSREGREGARCREKLDHASSGASDSRPEMLLLLPSTRVLPIDQSSGKGGDRGSVRVGNDGREPANKASLRCMNLDTGESDKVGEAGPGPWPEEGEKAEGRAEEEGSKEKKQERSAGIPTEPERCRPPTMSEISESRRVGLNKSSGFSCISVSFLSAARSAAYMSSCPSTAKFQPSVLSISAKGLVRKAGGGRGKERPL